MSRLDRLDDSVFIELYELTLDEVIQLRSSFADWRRS
jgi:hypothetical protein